MGASGTAMAAIYHYVSIAMNNNIKTHYMNTITLCTQTDLALYRQVAMLFLFSMDQRCGMKISNIHARVNSKLYCVGFLILFIECLQVAAKDCPEQHCLTLHCQRALCKILNHFLLLLCMHTQEEYSIGDSDCALRISKEKGLGDGRVGKTLTFIFKEVREESVRISRVGN